MKTINSASIEQIRELSGLFKIDHAFIQKINEEELKIKSNSQRIRTAQQKQYDERKSRSPKYDRYTMPSDTVMLGGNYYSNCNKLVTYRGQLLFNLRKWEEDKDPDFSAMLELA